MKRQSVFRHLGLASILLLAGCGFQLRQELKLPASLHVIRVEIVDPYTAIDGYLEEALKRAGASVAMTADTPSARLRIISLSQARNPLSVDAAGRAQEYELVYSAEFDVVDAENQQVVPKQRIDLRRDYLFDTARALGNRAEEDLVLAELQRDMADAILRRVDVALR
ncbi:MAG TPA: LPS assembly lipoprotein LptE [Aquimonas sp.]|nr:LPS assembly lipoprotein LptE [Aquimonas sp.]HRF54475.1 LPS assembly lipoprotein LptE [Aquimonas sp.]